MSKWTHHTRTANGSPTVPNITIPHITVNIIPRSRVPQWMGLSSSSSSYSNWSHVRAT